MLPGPIHKPALIAHRGDAANFPENSLAAVKGALHCGLSWVEVDVQLSADRCPVVIHDVELLRTTGSEGLVGELSLEELQGLSVHEPERFGSRFQPTPLPTLSELVQLLAGFPQARLFVELKHESLQRFGRDKVLRAALESLGELAHRCIIISFDADVLRRTRRVSNLPIGWVLQDYDTRSRALARALAPEFVFVNGDKVDEAQPLWPEKWQWAIYEILTGESVIQWGVRGATLVESMSACALKDELEKQAAAPTV